MDSWRATTHAFPNARAAARCPASWQAGPLEQLGSIEIRSMPCWPPSQLCAPAMLDIDHGFLAPGGPLLSRVEGEALDAPSVDTSATGRPGPPLLPCGFTAIGSGWLSISTS